MAEKIIIGNGNPTTQKVQLSGDNTDKEHTKAKKGQSIEWHIKGGSNVTSIELIELYSDTYNIFSTLPYKDDKKWKAVIDGEAPDYTESRYFIKWRGPNNTGPYTHDPKISVDPNKSDSKTLLIGVVLGLLGLLSLGLLSRKKGRK